MKKVNQNFLIFWKNLLLKKIIKLQWLYKIKIIQLLLGICKPFFNPLYFNLSLNNLEPFTNFLMSKIYVWLIFHY